MSKMEEMKAIACFPEALKISKTNGKNLILFLLIILIPINLLSMLADHLLPPTLVIDFSPTRQISQHPYSPPPINQATKVEVNLVSTLLKMLSALATVYFSAMACSGEKTTLEALFLKARRTWWRSTITLFYVQLFMLFPLPVLLLMLRVPGLTEKMVYFLGSSFFIIVMLLFSGFMVLWFLLLSFGQRWGVVSSIIEEGLYGMGAIKKSTLVFMRRRKLQVFLLFLLSLPQEWVVYKVGSCMKTGESIQIAWALPLYLLGTIYDSLVYTVFFCYNNL